MVLLCHCLRHTRCRHLCADGVTALSSVLCKCMHVACSKRQSMKPRITGKFPGYLSPSAGLKFALPSVHSLVPFICFPIYSGFTGSASKTCSRCLLSENFSLYHAYLTDLLLSDFRKSYAGCTLAPLLERAKRSRWQSLSAEQDKFRFTAAVAWRLQQRTRCC